MKESQEVNCFLLFLYTIFRWGGQLKTEEKKEHLVLFKMHLRKRDCYSFGGGRYIAKQ